jgi:hypothetical protein
VVKRAVRGVRYVIRRPADALLALQVGGFLLRAPADLERVDLPGYLGRLRERPRPPAPDVRSGLERVTRIRNAWLRLPWFRRRNTCYLRALTLYRFVDAGDRALQLHLGVEPAASPSGRLRGHAWVSIDDGELLEGPPDDVLSRVTEIAIEPRLRPTDADGASLEWRVLLASVGDWPRAEVATLVERGPDWTIVLQLATWNRLAGMLRHGLREAGVLDQVPEPARAQLTDSYHLNGATEAARRNHLVRVLGRLQDERIPAMLLKGAALAETAYPPGLRPMSDIDVLIPDTDVERAHDALQHMGYVPSPAPYPGDKHHHLIGLTSPDGLVTFELLRALMSPRSPLQLDVDRFWSHARPAAGPGPAHVLPSPEDLLLHVCVHFARDRLRGSVGALGQICDITALVRNGDLDWERLCLEPVAPGARAAVFLALASAVRLLRAPVPPQVLTELAPGDREEADALIGQFVEQRVLRFGDRPGLALEQLAVPSMRMFLRSPTEEPGRTNRRLSGLAHQLRRSARAEGMRDLRLDRRLHTLYRDGEL